MKLDALASWLFGRSAGGIRWGLERTRELLAAAGDPHLGFRSVHIGGTNGKGSVAALCDAVLRADGRRVGLYTSPHLVSFTERVRIDGAPIDEELLLRIAERMRPEIERTGATFFEATTALAFACFAELGVELAVVEVGLGGRLDATNVLDPVATGVTNIGLEHTDYLGTDPAGIAREKAGIFKRGVPALTAERDPELLAVMRGVAAGAGTTLVAVDEVAAVRTLETGLAGSRLRLRSRHWGDCELDLALPGEFQTRNALLAAELLAVLPPALRPSPAALAVGCAGVRWPGRLQLWRGRGVDWLFDIAHNPAGAAALRDAVVELPLRRPLVVLAGVLADKDWTAMLPPLLREADAAILCIPDSAPPARRWNPHAAAAVLEAEGAVPVQVVPGLADAVDRAAALAGAGTVLVTGSIHTVGDTMRRLGVSPYGEPAAAGAAA